MNDAPKRDQQEHALSHWVNLFLERTIVGACWFTAVDTGTYRPGATREQWMAAEQKRRAMGIKPSHLDFYLWQKSTGQFTQFELKVKGRKTRLGQDQTMVALRHNQIPTSVCETVPEVCEFLATSGFVLHGNARNIAAELHERYLAQRQAKAAQPAQPKTAARRRPQARPGLSWIGPKL